MSRRIGPGWLLPSMPTQAPSIIRHSGGSSRHIDIVIVIVIVIVIGGLKSDGLTAPIVGTTS